MNFRPLLYCLALLAMIGGMIAAKPSPWQALCIAVYGFGVLLWGGLRFAPPSREHTGE